MTDTDPDYYVMVSRETVEALSRVSDYALATWALEMLSSEDEEAVFLRGARVFFERSGQEKRRKAITYLATVFGANRQEMKRYLRFKGLVNQMD